jgi:hypothetical protein
VAEVVAMEQVAGEAVPVDEVRAPDWVVVTLLPAGTLEAGCEDRLHAAPAATLAPHWWAAVE